MASWSTGTANWARSERTVSMNALIVCLVIMLVFGGVVGYVVHGSTSVTSKLSAKNFRQSDVIDPSTDAMLAADESSDGAVRAVTSFISGLPEVALQTPQQESGVLDQVMDPNADPAVRAQIQNIIDSGRDQLVGTASYSQPLNAKLVFSPASYRVDMLAKNRARVQVWMVGTVVDATTQTSIANWTTSDIQVTWSDHWRLTTYNATDGPTPTIQALNGQTSPFPDVLNRINGFTAYRYAVGTTGN